MMPAARSIAIAVGASLLTFTTSPLHAQGRFEQEIAPIEVDEGDGHVLGSPFSGGLVSPRVGLIDLDGDSLPELFALNPDGRLRTYNNLGGGAFRRLHPSPYDTSPVNQWFRLADLDDDGAVDLLTGGLRSELLFYRNVGTTAAPVWPQTADTVRTDMIVFTQLETVPSLVDIDGDGDLDLFTGNLEGSITFYRNDGTRKVPKFVLATQRFQDILVVSFAARRRKEPLQTPQHGASVLDFTDLDGDRDLDMLFGDFFTTRLLYFRNDGTRFSPNFSMNRLDTAFRGMGDDVATYGFNQPIAADLDRDGDVDVLVSSLYPNSPLEPLLPFINTGTTTAPVMRLRTGGLTDELDVGTSAAPCVLRDADRWSIVVGNADGTLAEYEVVDGGGKTMLRRERTHGAVPGRFNATPTAGDLDDDGIAEVITGSADGSDLRLLRRSANDLVAESWLMDTAVVGRYATPALVDMEGDGDLDLLVGSAGGRLTYFRNDGTPQVPAFVATTPPRPFDTLDVGSYSAPCPFDIDGDGDVDVLIGGRARAGDRTGVVRFWINNSGRYDESPAYPPLVTDGQPLPVGFVSSAGRFVLVGEAAGGITAWRDTSYISSAPSVRGMNGRQLTIEVLDRERIRIVGNIPNEGTSLRLFDILGRDVFRSFISGDVVGLPHLPHGWYLVDVAGLGSGSLIVPP